MNIGHPAHQKVGSVAFSFYDAETIRKISVKQITVPILFDDDNKPIKGGLYDPALGPVNKSDRCATCQLSYFVCPGHFGHIELAVPVYNPLTFSQLLSLYKNMCIYCHHFRQSPNKLLVWKLKLKLLRLGLYFEAKDADQVVGQFSKLGRSDKLCFSETAAKESESCEGGGTDHDLGLLLKKYYKQCKKQLREHAPDSKPLKSSVVEQYRREIIGEFLQRFCSNRCQYCSGFVPAIYHTGTTKIFEIPLSQRLATAMQTKSAAPANISETEADTGYESDSLGSDDEFPSQPEPSSKRKNNDAQVPPKLRTKAAGSQSLRNYKYLTSLQILERLKRLWENESELLSLIYGQSSSKASPAMFFVELIPVPPARFRPPSEINGQLFEHPQNFYLTSIIKLSDAILSARTHHHASTSESEAESVLSATTTTSSSSSFKEHPSLLQRTIDSWTQLQEQVNYFYDSSKASTKNKTAPPGIKQVMEKKEGLFRKHMMGKRVNYAARSVISPDVNIETNEIGLPMVFATRLTYAEPVTRYNVHQLRQNVINGPKIHPGATHIEHEDGTLTSLGSFSLESRTALANQLLTPQGGVAGASASKRVLRHIQDGDILLLNRQPTLHKPSIMAHRCRVLPNEKTIRMHYANCNTYNADFDGDEMNIHFPQSELGRAEAYLIANTDNQYLVPTDGSPLRGLIQDHVVTGVLLTMRDCLLDRETYQHILYGSLPESTRRIITIPPAILKPLRRWTGKQAITTLLLNLTIGYPRLNLESKTKIPGRLWGAYANEESLVRFVDGYLATGVLDKAQFGATAYGLAHACYELYGPPVTGQLLTALGKLFTKFLQIIGFTCRMDDLVLTRNADASRRDTIDKNASAGRTVALDYVDLGETSNASSLSATNRELHFALERVLRNDEALRGLDAAMKGKMNEITTKIIEQCLPDGQWRPFPKNNMSMMTMSGAKGSIVNFSQISGALGQQELEGRRVPVMVSGRSLPSFEAFDTSARAGGYITGRFLTGIRPQEYFFHCMAGREGLIDTAVKTSRSGYLQRCLVKHLESLKVQYDQTVRDSEGSIVQFYYGEDALDVTKQKCLTHFGFLAANLKSLIQKYDPATVLDRIESDTAWKYAKKAAAHPEKYEPVMSAFTPAVYLGSVSEKFHLALEKYIRDNPDGLLKTKSKGASEQAASLAEPARLAKEAVALKQFRALMWLKYMKSLAEPGESVGVLAAQSVGEPSTQMTLNTFHFAGFGAKNVTLGIPRLREIIMTASKKIKTPTMSIPLSPTVSKEEANAMAQRLSRLTLGNLIVDARVTEKIVKVKSGSCRHERLRTYRSRLQFMSREECKARFAHLRPSLLVEKIEQQFIAKLLQNLARHTKPQRKDASGPAIVTRAAEAVRHTSLELEDNADEEDEGPSAKGGAQPLLEADQDMDASVQDITKSKKKKFKKQISSYDDLDASSSASEPSSHSETESEARTGLTDAESEAEGSETDGDRESGDNEGENEDKEEEKESGNPNKRLCPAVHPSPATLDMAHVDSPLQSIAFDSNSGLLTFELVYPINRPKVLLVPFIEQALEHVIVQEVPSIKRCFVSEETILDTATGITQPSLVLATEGVNFHGFSDLSPLLILNRIYSNDVFAVLSTYGVEAARTVIIREIAAVFAVYGISVDTRHLSLIADYMTFEGKYRAMSRLGIASCVSPFSKMTFETTFQFLKAATLFGDYDDLASPSARLVVGQVAPVGTGLVEMIQPIHL